MSLPKIELEEHDEIASTQARALELAASSAPEGTVVVARRQTAGTGRYGHTWASPEGGLWMSTLVSRRPEPPPDALAISLVAALAARAAIARTVSLETRLKWPNDLLVGRRKLGGTIASERGGLIAIGLGIDANFRRADLPPDVAPLATSIMEETDRFIPLDVLMNAVLEELWARIARWRAGDGMLREEAWGCLIRDHVVRWKGGGGASAEGRIAMLEPSGALTIDTPGGSKTVMTGDLEILWPKEK